MNNTSTNAAAVAEQGMLYICDYVFNVIIGVYSVFLFVFASYLYYTYYLIFL
jgi:hypothetical protein